MYHSTLGSRVITKKRRTVSRHLKTDSATIQFPHQVYLTFAVQTFGTITFAVFARYLKDKTPPSLKLTERPLLLCDVPLSTCVSVGSALQSRRVLELNARYLWTLRQAFCANWWEITYQEITGISTKVGNYRNFHKGRKLPESTQTQSAPLGDSGAPYFKLQGCLAHKRQPPPLGPP